MQVVLCVQAVPRGTGRRSGGAHVVFGVWAGVWAKEEKQSITWSVLVQQKTHPSSWKWWWSLYGCWACCCCFQISWEGSGGSGGGMEQLYLNLPKKPFKLLCNTLTLVTDLVLVYKCWNKIKMAVKKRKLSFLIFSWEFRNPCFCLRLE